MSFDDTVVTIDRIKKGKRVALFFVELFLNFIIATFLFSVMVYPIAQTTSLFKETDDNILLKQQENVKFLYENDLLLYDEKSKDDFTESMKYTAKEYVLSWISDTGSDVIDHYFVDLRGNTKEQVIQFYQQHDSGFFDFEPELKMKDRFVEEFQPLLDEYDVLSSQGQYDYEKLCTYYFPELYTALINDLNTIKEGPLSLYHQNNEEINQWKNNYRWIVTFCVSISYVLSCLVSFLVFPLVSKNGKTITMLALRTTRTGLNTLRPISIKERVVLFFLQSLFYLSLVMFIPMFYVSFGELFSIAPLLFTSLASLMSHVISLVILLMDPNGRTLLDKTSKTVLIDDNQLDKIKEMKGFKIEHE